MTYSLEEFDSLLSRTKPNAKETHITVLRKWRTELVRASVFVSYSIGVLSLDLEMIKHSITAPEDDNLQTLVDELPNVLAKGWVGGGWSLSPDASASVGAAAELDATEMQSLTGLHAELISSDLNDAAALEILSAKIDQQRKAFITVRDQIEQRIKQLQSMIREKYKNGTASVDDWLL